MRNGFFFLIALKKSVVKSFFKNLGHYESCLATTEALRTTTRRCLRTGVAVLLSNIQTVELNVVFEVRESAAFPTVAQKKLVGMPTLTPR